MRAWAAASVACVVSLAGASSGLAQSIDWEVVGRFRLFANPSDQNAYLNARQTILTTKGYRPLLLQPKNDFKLGWDVNWPTHWDERREQYDRGWVHDARRTVWVRLTGVPQGATCHWSIGGDTSCRDRAVPAELDKKLTVSVDIVRKGVPTKKLATEIEPKDILVMVLGDSVGSGEGNPHLRLRAGAGESDTTTYPAIWWDTRCHRSLLSGPAQAAVVYSERHPKQSVTFVSYACSGAEINDGVLTKYEGRETINQIKDLLKNRRKEGLQIEALKAPDGSLKPEEHMLPPQIERAEQVLCPPDPAACTKRRPDVLIIAVGGNDIGFGEIGRKLLLSDPGPDVQKWRSEREAEITPYFADLDKAYEQLASAVRARIAPSRVLLMQYMDPSQYDRGKFCGRERTSFDKAAAGRSKSLFDERDPSRKSTMTNFNLYNLLVMRDESRLAHWVVGNLNTSVRHAAETLTWTGEGGKASLVRLQDLAIRRGYCVPNSWFIRILESYDRQDWIPSDSVHKYPLKLTRPEDCPDPLTDGVCKAAAGNVTSGILHPNFFGHFNAAREILKSMEAALSK